MVLTDFRWLEVEFIVLSSPGRVALRRTVQNNPRPRSAVLVSKLGDKPA